MSPELCKKEEHNGQAADMWAIGVLFYTILFGFQPFRAKNESQLLQTIIKGKFIFPESSHPEFRKNKSESEGKMEGEKG